MERKRRRQKHCSIARAGLALEALLFLFALSSTAGVVFAQTGSGCTMNATDVQCDGFLGDNAFVPLPGWRSTMIEQPANNLWFQQYGWYGGCSFTPSAVELRTASSSTLAFEASYSFSFTTLTRSFYKGFAFVLTKTPACGQDTQILYGGANGGFDRSVGVEIRYSPIPCVAVVTKGQQSGDGCVQAKWRALLADSVPLVSGSVHRAWVSYDGGLQQLQVFLSLDKSAPKPSSPVLVAPLDLISEVNSSQVHVGFTGGSYWWWEESQRVYDLSYTAVHPGQLTPSTPSEETPSCLFTNTTISCPGFGGPSQLSFLAGAGTGTSSTGAAILLEKTSVWGGCAFTPNRVNLSSSESSPLAFSANFSFLLDAEGLYPGRGITFVLTPTSGGCGDGNQLSYGGTDTFRDSVAVVVRGGASVPCIAITTKGRAGSSSCYNTLSKSDITIPFFQKRRYWVWVEYDGESNKMAVSLSANTTKPDSPLLVAELDVKEILGSNTAYVAFTGGNECCNWEYQYIYDLFLQPATPGTLSSLSVTPPLVSCGLNQTYLSCRGFAGFTTLYTMGGPGVTPEYPHPLNMEYSGAYGGCAFSPEALNLSSLSGNSSNTAFEASFAFSFDTIDPLNPSVNTTDSKGLVFVVSASGRSCGSWDQLHYGGNSEMRRSVAVIFRKRDKPCVAVNWEGNAAGEYCVYADYRISLDPDFTYAWRTVWYAWVSYDGSKNSMLVYLSPTATKPSEPVLSTRVNVSEQLKTDMAYVGFTAASSCCLWETHTVHNVSFSLVPLGEQPLVPATPKTRSCTYSDSGLSCSGFAGTYPFQLSYYYPGLTPEPEFALDLLQRGYQGCASSPRAFNLSSVSGTGELAFDASFDFIATEASRPGSQRGFTFMLKQAEGPVCGNYYEAGYGGTDRLVNSVAVEIRLSPVPCVALVWGSRVAGDHCIFADQRATLAPSVLRFGNLSRAWVSYDGSQQTMHIYLSSDLSKPASPTLVANLDLAWYLSTDTAYVGFTAGVYPDGSWEKYFIYNASFAVVPGGQLPSLPPAPLTPQCSFNESGYNCPAFGGYKRMGFVGQARVTPEPEYDLVLEQSGYYTYGSGCAWTPDSYDLKNRSTDGTHAFDAQFSFAFVASEAAGSRRGFAFVLTQRTIYGLPCGHYEYLSYGGDWRLSDSVAVVFRMVPTPCVAIVWRGNDGGANCIYSDTRLTLPSDIAFVPNATYTAWVSYDGSKPSFQVFLSANATKPDTPILVSGLSMPGLIKSDLALVGFTGGSEWSRNPELHTIFDASFQVVTPGQLEALPITPPPASCVWTEYSFNCSGFAGASPWRFHYAVGPTPEPEFAMELLQPERGSPGCAYSIMRYSMSAFDMRFIFKFRATRLRGASDRGFMVVFAPQSDYCAGSDYGYSDNWWPMQKTAGVVFQMNPKPCIALVTTGRSPKDYCTFSDFRVELSGDLDEPMKEND